MIRNQIECEWPGCKITQLECKEGMGFNGWGHIRGLKLDGELRDFHLCPQHLIELAIYLKEKRNGLDRP